MCVLLNQSAGSVLGENLEEVLARVRTIFSSHGILADVRMLSGTEASEAARQAIAGGVDGVVAGGGDGTVSCLAGVLAGTEVPLGVLPLGTFNHFAKDLRLPSGLDEAIGVIGNGQWQAIDVAEVNGHVFINNSSIGAYPRAVADREVRRKKTGLSKPIAMLLAAATTLWRRPLWRVKLLLNSQMIRRTTPFVFVGNNQYSLELFAEALRPRLNAGQLCVFAARSGSFWTLLRLAWQALFNQLHVSADFDSWSVDQVQIQMHGHNLRVALDGEVIRLEPPLHYRVRPQALRVFAPSAA